LDGNFALGCGLGTDYSYIHISMYARRKGCYNGRGSGTVTLFLAQPTVCCWLFYIPYCTYNSPNKSVCHSTQFELLNSRSFILSYIIPTNQVHTHNFSLAGEAEPEAIYRLGLNLKIVIISYLKYDSEKIL